MSEPKNRKELSLWNELRKGGWECFRNGYPDIMARKNGKLIAIEVKSKETENLQQDQLIMMELLNTLGIECFRWTRKTGLIKLDYSIKPKPALLTKSQLVKRDRDARIKVYYQVLPEDMKNTKGQNTIAGIFGVSRSTVLYAVNGRAKRSK